MTDIAPSRYDAWACDHAETAIRVRTRSNRTEVFALQCLTCGAELRAYKKQSPEVRALAEHVPFDEALKEQWQRDVQARWLDTYTAQQRERKAQQDARQGDWWDAYNEYLQTPEWRARRQKVFDRAHGWCEGCGMRQAAQVHHKTYDHVGNEFLFELVAVCWQCHERLHAREDAA
jgi:hypothetical protein